MKFSYIFAIAIALILSSASMGYAQSEEGANTAEVAAASIKAIKTKVKGVGCATDVKTIADNIKKLNGVTVCEAGKVGATTTFNITYNSLLVKEKDIHAAIENTGGCKDPNEKPYKVKR